MLEKGMEENMINDIVEDLLRKTRHRSDSKSINFLQSNIKL